MTKTQRQRFRTIARGGHESGISVIEMVVIVGIIAILCTIAIPIATSATRAYTLSNAANALAQQFNLARQEAVKANQPIFVTVVGRTINMDRNHDGSVNASDGTAATISQDTGVTVTSSSATSSTSSGVTTYTIKYSSRGDIPIGDPLPTFTVSYKGKSRNVQIDARGSVSISDQS